MIIVSQNKEWIFNFNNTTSIGIDEENGDYAIEIISITSTWAELGEYKTKARAEEVLQEIIKAYSDWKNLEAGQAEGTPYPVYEMPEE